MLPGSARSGTKPLVALSDCLFGCDREQLSRERRIRREALLLSILFQLAAVAALVLVPLFDSANLIAHAGTTPRPPYIFVSGPAHGPTNELPRGQRTQPPCIICAPRTIPPTISTAPERPGRPTDDAPPGIGNNPPVPDGFIPIISDHPRGPQPLVQQTQTTRKPDRVLLSHLQSGMLLYRVEPIYPSICLQTRREGRVELHAIISTDGTIQSLQVVSGDPLFFQSAISAVRQWRYRPTTLGGAPVEVETEITVIYQMQR
jgi:protein TonB